MPGEFVFLVYCDDLEPFPVAVFGSEGEAVAWCRGETRPGLEVQRYRLGEVPSGDLRGSVAKVVWDSWSDRKRASA